MATERNLKAKLTPETRYRLEVGDQVFNDLKIVSEWEGMKKLSSPSGMQVIVHDERGGNFAQTFDRLFGKQDEQTFEAAIVKAHPVILNAAMGKGEAE